MAWLAALTIALIALAIAPGYFFYFDITPKALALLAGASLMLCAAAFRAAVKAPRWFSALLLLNLVSLALSTALSSNPALSAFGTNWRRFGFVTQSAVLLFSWLVLAATAGHTDRIRTILRGVAAAGAIAALYGIGQYFGWDLLLPAAAYHIGEGIWSIVRPPATMGYVSYFASWEAGASLLALALAAIEKNPLGRWLAFGSAALMTIATLLTGTRGAALGLVAGLAVWAVSRGFRFSRGIITAAALLLAAGAAFYFSPAGWKLHSRARWAAEDPWGGARPWLWRDSLRMSVHRLPAGFGPEVFTADFPRFESATLAKAYPDFAHESPHNMFLDVLVAQGLPGLLILAAFCVMAFRSAAAPWIRASLAAQIVSQQFIVFTIPTGVLFFATVALSIPKSRSGETVAWTWRRRAAALAVAAAMLFVAVRMAVADHELALVKSRLDGSDLSGAIAHQQAWERWRLPGTSSDVWLSRAFLAYSQRNRSPVEKIQAAGQAGMAARRAPETADDPFNAWYNLSAFYAAQNDAKATEECLRRAIAAHPNWYKPHWTLAQVLRLEGRRDEAEREASLAADLNGGKHPEVARTLAEIRQAAHQE